MTHPFHPWSGREFEFIAVRRTWEQDRVFFFDRQGTQRSLPRAFTDAADPDAFVTVAAGRSPLKVADLLELVELVRIRAAAREADRV